MSAPEVGPVTRFGRLERRGVLLGLAGGQLAVVAAGVLVAVVAVYSAGVSGLALAAPVWGALLALGTVSAGGRAALAWVPLLSGWLVRRCTGATIQAAAIGTRDVGDGLALPGVPGALELVDCAPLGGVLVVDRRAGTATGVLRVTGSGFVLDESGAQQHKVDGWGRVMAAACQQPSTVRLQLLARTVPGGLAASRRWWREHCAAPRGPVAEALAAMLDEGFVTPSRRETLLAVAVRRPRGRGGLSGEGLALVARHLDGVGSAVAAAGLAPEAWLDRDELMRAVHSALDPEAAARAEEGPHTRGGAVGVRERWSSLTTGTAEHATFWVREWPRAATHPAFLQPLLLAEATTRTVALVAEPVATSRALRDIRRAKVEHVSDAAQRTRMGQIEDEATRAEVADLERREAEIVAGHGDLRFTGMVTVSAPDEVRLEERCAAMESAAAQAMCEVRRLVGQQGMAFLAAGLPLARGVL